MNFTDKKVLVTGGLGGIGYETCLQLLRENLKCLIIIDYQPTATTGDSKDKISKLKEINKTTTIIYYRNDVSDKLQMDQIFKEIAEQFKTIDICLGMAGISNEHKMERVINVNLIGTIYIIMNAINLMSKTSENGNGGIILIVASIVGLQPLYAFPSYTASKHGIIGFVRSLSHEYHYNLHGIKMITACPGFTDTPLTDNLEQISISIEAGLKLANELENVHKNTGKEMAKYLIDMAKTAENGSVWIADKEVKEVNLPTYWP